MLTYLIIFAIVVCKNMVRIKSFTGVLCGILILFSEHSFSQPSGNFSRWYIGATGGTSLLFGDFRSVTADKKYFGLTYGAFLGYQLSSWVGLEGSVSQSKTKSGSPEFAKENYIGKDGMTYYHLFPENLKMWKYGEVYSSTTCTSVGFHLNFTVSNLFSENFGDRKWTVLLSPALYAQHFSSSIKHLEDNTELTPGASSPDLNFGLGGALALRYRLNHHIDLQLKSEGIWVNNTAFEGVRTVIRTKGNGLWNTGLAVIWKINGRRKNTDNLLYGPTSPYKNRIRTRTWRCQ